MEEDSPSPPPHIECSASAQPGSSGSRYESLDNNIAVTAAASAYTSSSTASTAPSTLTTSSRLSRRTCSRPTCNRVLGNLHLDPHTTCIGCRGYCNSGKRCVECADWPIDKITQAFDYQAGLRRKRDAKASRGRPSCQVSRDSNSPDAAILETSAQEELTADDSASQQGSKPPVAIDLSLFLKSWQDQLLASVNSLVSSQLQELRNPMYCPATDSSVPGPSSPSVPDLMQFSVLPPQSSDAKRCVQSHQVRGPGGADRGFEAPLKRSRPPKDDAKRIKKSRPTTVVAGNLAPLSQGRPVGRDTGGEGRGSNEPGPPPMALGEGPGGCGAVRPSCPANSPVGLQSHAPPRAAASVLSANRGPVSHDPPTAHQIHYFAPEGGQDLPSPSHSEQPGSGSGASPSHSEQLGSGGGPSPPVGGHRSPPHPLDRDRYQYLLPDPLPYGNRTTPLTHHGVPVVGAGPRHLPYSAQTDSRLTSSALFLSERNDRQAPHDPAYPSCSGWRDAGRSLSPEPDAPPHDKDTRLWLPSSAEGGEGHELPPHAPSMYHHMMQYINSVFEDAMGQQCAQEGPLAPGTDPSPSRSGSFLLGRAQPIQFFMEQANTAYLKATEKKPASVGYPSGKFAKLYRVRGQEVYGQAAKVNPNIHGALHSGSKEPRIIRDHLDVSRMEGTVARSRDALNYTYWCLGALHLLAARHLPQPLLDLEHQLFKAVRLALNDICRDTTYVIANLRAWRRESYLNYLRPTFSQVEKTILRRSPIFSPLLFDEDRLQEAIQSSGSNANMILHEAAIKALSRPRPTPGTPLVERGSRPSTTTAARPSAVPPRRPPAHARPRDSRGGSSRFHSSRTSTKRDERRGQSFRK